ncbi:MAG: hypothetical protein WBJ17_04980 [Natronincolaceae bacterium]
MLSDDTGIDKDNVTILNTAEEVLANKLVVYALEITIPPMEP